MSTFYINQTAIEYLVRASAVAAPSFMCFGKHYAYLRKWNFIDDENRVTYLGRQFVKAFRKL